MQAVQRRTGQNIRTAFADTDDTNFILEHMNDALEDLQALKTTYIDAETSFNVTNTRTFTNPVAGLDLYDTYPWSWRIIDSNSIPHQLINMTLEAVMEQYPRFETDTSPLPQFYYFDQGNIGLYPLLNSGSLTAKFRYPTTSTVFVNTTDSINYPQKWILYIKKYAQFNYEVFKGIGSPEVTEEEAEDIFAEIAVKEMKQKKTRILPYRSFRSGENSKISDTF